MVRTCAHASAPPARFDQTLRRIKLRWQRGRLPTLFSLHQGLTHTHTHARQPAQTNRGEDESEAKNRARHVCSQLCLLASLTAVDRSGLEHTLSKD